MPVMTLKDGTKISYEFVGEGPVVTLISGGRREGAWLKPTAEKMAAAGYRVLLHDRRNCGASDVVIERRFLNGRELSEQEIWVEDLHELQSRLGVEPCWIGGTSAGCRIALLMAIRYPEAVRGLLLWRVTGGEYAARVLGNQYYEVFNEVAEKAGMQGVIETPFFAARIRQNPANRDRLLAMDPQEFIAIMAYWRTFFTAETPVVGATVEEIKAIKHPTLIIAGDDDNHPTPVAQEVAGLIAGSEYLAPQWTKEESDKLLADDAVYAVATAEKLPPVLTDFLRRHQ